MLITAEEVAPTAANTPLHSEQQLQQHAQDAPATANSHTSFNNDSSNSNNNENATATQLDTSNSAGAESDDVEVDETELETELESVEDEETEPVYLTVGDYFGEDAIINPTERTATYKVYIVQVCMCLLLLSVLLCTSL